MIVDLAVVLLLLEGIGFLTLAAFGFLNFTKLSAKNKNFYYIRTLSLLDSLVRLSSDFNLVLSPLIITIKITSFVVGVFN